MSIHSTTRVPQN